jgi:hypothetical protein
LLIGIATVDSDRDYEAIPSEAQRPCAELKQHLRFIRGNLGVDRGIGDPVKSEPCTGSADETSNKLSRGSHELAEYGAG